MEEGIMDRVKARSSGFGQGVKNFKNKVVGAKNAWNARDGEGEAIKAFDKEKSKSVNTNDVKKKAYVDSISKKLNVATKKIQDRHEKELSKLRSKIERELMNDVFKLSKGDRKEAQDILTMVKQKWTLTNPNYRK